MSNKRPHKFFSKLIFSFLRSLFSFYETGYQDGYDHGRIHGLIEGRALGREKGYEMWEELGFYEGFASTWRTFLLRHETSDDEYVYLCTRKV